MHSFTCMPVSSSSSYTFLKPNLNPLLGATTSSRPFLPLKRRTCFTTTALLSSTKESVLKDFQEKRALKIISGLQNFNKDNVASVVTASDKYWWGQGVLQENGTSDLHPWNPYFAFASCKLIDEPTTGGATHVDIACDPELVKLALSLTSCPVCVSSVDPATFPAAVEAGALMVEIGNYDSFYEKGIVFTPQQILGLTKETRMILPSVVLSVTVPHTLSLPDQVKLAESLEQEGVDIIQTEGGKSSNPTKSGVLGLIEKATPTLAAAYSISRAVKIPVMCSSGISAVTAPMAITAGAAGVGVGSAVNRLNDVVAMIAEVRSIASSLQIPSQICPTHEAETQRVVPYLS